MSVATTKMNRFTVSFDGHRIYVNAGNKGGALALARTRFFKVYKEAGVEPPSGMASLETFSCEAVAAESLRY